MHAGRGPLFRLAGNRALCARCALQRRLEVVPRSTRTPSLTSTQPDPGAADLDESKIVARHLLLASCNRPKPLQPVEEELDEISLPIEFAVEARLLLSTWCRMNDRLHVVVTHFLAEFA